MFERFLNLVIENNFVRDGDRILLAFSGGVDSVCLFHLLRKLSFKIPHEIAIAYVTHVCVDDWHDIRLSSSEYEWVRGFAEIYDLRLYHEFDLLEISNIQFNARKARYLFFLNIMKNYSYDKLFLAHHADDQIETFFLNLMRSSSAKIINSVEIFDYFDFCDANENNFFDKCSFDENQKMNLYDSYFKRNFRFDNVYFAIRPLLSFYKFEISDYVFSNDYSFFYDKSNLDLKYFRNRIRFEFIPYFKEFFPDFDKKILKFTKYNSQLENVFKSYLQKIYDFLVIRDYNGFEMAFDLRAFYQLSYFLQINLLKLIFKKVFFKKNINANYQSSTFENILSKILCYYKSGTIIVFSSDDFAIYIEYDKLIVEMGKNSISYFNLIFVFCDFEYLLYLWQSFFYKISVCCFNYFDILDFNFLPYTDFTFSDYFIIDKDLIFGSLVIRKYSSSDFIPISGKGKKKLQTFLIDKKIPKRLRHLVLLLCDDRQVISVFFPVYRQFLWFSSYYLPGKNTKNVIFFHLWRLQNKKSLI